jgi:hypothetical protein
LLAKQDGSLLLTPGAGLSPRSTRLLWRQSRQCAFNTPQGIFDYLVGTSLGFLVRDSSVLISTFSKRNRTVRLGCGGSTWNRTTPDGDWKPVRGHCATPEAPRKGLEPSSTGRQPARDPVASRGKQSPRQELNLRRLLRSEEPEPSGLGDGVTYELRSRQRPVHNRSGSPAPSRHHTVRAPGVEPGLPVPETGVLPQTLCSGADPRFRAELFSSSGRRFH